MAAGARLVAHPTSAQAPARVLVDNIDVLTVYAENDADAIAVAKAQRDGDINALWGAATVTPIVAAANMVGWRMRVRVCKPQSGAPITDLYDVTVTGAGSDDTLDEIAALMVTALEAAGGAALTPSYNSGTQVLTVAVIGDGIGDHSVLAEFYPPAANVKQNVNIPGFIVSQVHQGIAGAVLTVTLAADGYVVPKVYGQFRQV